MKECVIEKVVKTTTTGYLLELEKNEVKFLFDVLTSVGGTPDNSVRQYADSIVEKMMVNPYWASYYEDMVDSNESDKRFKDIHIYALEGSKYFEYDPDYRGPGSQG